MHAGTDELLEEQNRGLAELARNFRKARVAAARQAARDAAVRIKSLNVRVRTLARSGFQLSNISHETVQKLIDLQAEIVNAALTEAAARIERLAYTENVRDLARGQADVLQSARQRIVDDLSRALAILKESGSEAREVAARAYQASASAKPARPVTRKVKGKAPVRAKARAATRTPARAPAKAKRAAKPRPPARRARKARR